MQKHVYTTGPLDCVKAVYRAEGLRTFWSGSTPALASAMAENSVLFATTQMWKDVFPAAGADGNHTLAQLYVFGGLSGIFTSLAMCPAEVRLASVVCFY